MRQEKENREAALNCLNFKEFKGFVVSAQPNDCPNVRDHLERREVDRREKRTT